MAVPTFGVPMLPKWSRRFPGRGRTGANAKGKGGLAPLLAGVLVLTVLVAACSGRATPTPTSFQPTRNSTPTAPSPPLLPGGFADVPSVVENVMASVVSVLTTVESRDFFGRVSENIARGSGVIFDEAGYVLTNNHVVEGGTKVEVVMSDGRRLEVEVVGRDPSTDLAVLKLDLDEVPRLVVTPLGDTEALRIGEWVIAIGNPLGLEGSVTVGVVSAKGRVLPVSPGVILEDLVQTDAVINPGNSGGPLLNLRGEVVGINTAIIRGRLSSGQEAEGIGFAVSMSTAKPVTDQLIRNGRVVWPWLGVSVRDVTPVVAAEEGLAVYPGVLVVGAVSGGPAEKAGVEAGDVIVALDEGPVAKLLDLRRLLRNEYRIGDTVTVEVVRGDDRLSIDVTLEEMPR